MIHPFWKSQARIRLFLNRQSAGYRRSFVIRPRANASTCSLDAVIYLLIDDPQTHRCFMKHPFFDAYYDRLAALHADVKAAIQGLPQAALDWVPGPEMNSVGVLVIHLTGAERYWIGDLIGEDASSRVRADEFTSRGVNLEALFARLEKTLAHSRVVLENLDLSCLDQEFYAPTQQKRYTGAWCLLHALEHTAQHAGHLQLARQMWLQHSAS